MAEERIVIEMEGPDEEGGDVRLADFLHELTAIRDALRLTQRSVTKDSDPVSYRVIDLSRSSPCRVTIGIVSTTPVHSETPRKIGRRFTSSLRIVRSRHRYAERFGSAYIDDLKKLTVPIEKKRMKTVRISRENEPEIRIDQQFSHNLEKVVIEDYRERDEIIGIMDQLNVHDKAQFHIYPGIGPQKITCFARQSLRTKITDCAGQRVAVDGWALYRKHDRFPYAIKVEDIERLPPEDELPRLADLHGIAPDATNGMSPEDFVREFRDANW